MITPSRRTTWLLLILGTLLLLSLAGSTAAGPAAQSDDRPPNATTDVEITIDNALADDADIKIIVSWQTRYPARSAHEAEQADDGTLDASWFQGENEMTEFATEYPDAVIKNSSTSTQHVDIGGGKGDISVVAGTTVELQFDSNRKQITVGPQLAESLSEGDQLSVEIREDWTPESATVEGNPEVGIGWKAYSWEIGEGPEPRFVLNESGVSSESSGGALGPDPFVPVLAIVLATIVLTRKQ